MSKEEKCDVRAGDEACSTILRKEEREGEEESRGWREREEEREHV